MASEEIIQAALKWAKMGVPVFPCNANKKPMTENGFKDGVTDPSAVRTLFGFYDGDVMIGGAMGKMAGLFACDFDLYKAGAKEYMQELSDKGLLTDSQTHTTKNGGLHIIYRSDSDFPTVTPHEGVDVKGEGGYVILPPSTGYAVAKSGIGYAKPELIHALMAQKRKSSASSIDALKAQVLAATSLHDPLAQIAARLSGTGTPFEEVQRQLRDILAASVAASPSHPRHERWAFLMADTGGEFSRIVSSGHEKYNYERHFDAAKQTIKPERHAEDQEAASAFFSMPRYEAENATPHTGEFLSIEDMDWPFEDVGYFGETERDVLSQRYIMYPLFAERETMLIAAEPKAGKTAIALKLAMTIAKGESLGESLVTTEANPVLYFTLEGARAVEMRIAAERRHRAANNIEPPETDMLFVVDRPHNFLQEDQQDANAAKIIIHDRKCQEKFGVGLGVVFIDTLTKAMPGGDQNSVEDTSRLFKIVDLLRAAGLKATICFVHHLGKSGSVRGSTNIEADVDIVLGVEKSEHIPGIVDMNIRRARSVDEAHHYSFKFTSFDLGKTVQGHQLSAPVVTLVTPSKAQDDLGMKAKEAKDWADLNDLLIDRLGSGKHDIVDVFRQLGDAYDVGLTKSRRPNAKSLTAQTKIRKVFLGKLNWAYADYRLRLVEEGELVAALQIIHAPA